MNSLISSPCDSSAEELNAGDQQPGLGAFDGFFEVLGEASVAAEPSEGPLHHPSPGQQNETLGRIRASDDLQRPGAEFGQRSGELRPGVATIGEDMAKPREGMSDRGQQCRRTIAILDVGGVDHGADQQSTGIGDDMALAPLDQLGRIEAPDTPLSVVFTDWLSITPADGLASRPAASRAAMRR